MLACTAQSDLLGRLIIDTGPYVAHKCRTKMYLAKSNITDFITISINKSV